MASVIEICNRALGRIGIDQFIEDLDDPNPRARACSLAYGPCLEDVLEDFAWNFAQAVEPLAPVSGVEVPGWQYVYRYPAMCAKVHRLTDAGGARSVRLPGGEIVDYAALIPARIPFTVMADPETEGARLIACDLANAYAWYTRKVTEPNQFTSLFRTALSWRLASELALMLSADTRLYVNARDQYVWAVSQAQVHSQAEAQPDPRPVSPSVMVRW